MITVTNGGGGFNIMRPSPLGNPFRIGRDGDRPTVIAKHRAWLWEVLWTNPTCDVARAFAEIVKAYMAGQDVRIVCCCAPDSCHGDNIRDFVIWFAERGGYPCP